MDARRVRDWRPITLAMALVATFVILLFIGTRRPDETQPTAAADGVHQDWNRKLGPGERPPQFVLFSYDGAGSHDQWTRLLELSGRSGARFTAFLSGVYL